MTSKPGPAPDHPSAFALRTLGAASLYEAGRHEVALGPGKPLALVVYLALSPGRRTSREFLMDLLWGDLEPDRARSALRQALFHLRRLLGEDALPGNEELTLARPVDSDRDRFLRAIEHGDLELALETYAGEFLPDFGVPGGAAFEQWADLERSRLRAAFLRCTELLVRRLLNQSRFREAQRLARRARDEVPHAEAAWRLVLESVVAGRDFVSAAVEALALEQWTGSEGVTLEPATRLAIARARQISPATGDGREVHGLVAELTGREREFAAITSAWEAVRTGPARHVHLRAPAGLGKTRLIRDAAARLMAAGARIVELRGAPGDRDIPYAFVGDLAAAIAELPGATGIGPASAAALIALNPALSSRLAGTADLVTGEEALRRRVQALADLVQAAAHEQPFVLVIDDLHWVDPSSNRVLEGLFGRLNGAHILCLTAARPERIPTGDGLRVLPLSPLTESQVSSLVSALGVIPETPWGSWFVPRLHQATGGSPLLVLETLRLAMDEGMLALDRGEWTCASEERLASLLRAGEALRQRIRALPREEGWVLALLATAGTPLPAESLAAAAGGSAAIGTVLEGLERQGLVARAGDGWSPGHDEIAAAARDALDTDRQAAAHRAIGQVMIDAAGADPHRLLRAVKHFVAAGAEDQVRLHFRRFARLCRQRGDPRPFRELAAEALGQDLAASDVSSLVGTLPVPWRLGLWNPTRQWLALAALALAVALGVALAQARTAREASLQRLVYLEGARSARVIHIQPSDFDGRDTPLQPVSATAGMADAARAFPDISPAISPDGRSVAWTQDSGDSTTLDIWIRTPAGTRRLTRQSRDDLVNSWLPDGSGIVGMTNRWSSPTAGNYDIAIFDTATGAARQITVGPEHDGQPFVSPDGTRIAFTREDVDGLTRVCVVPFDGQDTPSCRTPGGEQLSQLLGWSGPVELVMTLASGGTRPLVRYDWQRDEVTQLMGPHVYWSRLSPNRRWVLGAVQIGGIRGFRDWVIPLDRPTLARRVNGPSGAAVVRWWEGLPDSSALIDRIEFTDTVRTVLPGVGTRLGIRAFTAAGTEVPIHAPVRWHSSDTTTATVDSLGDVLPREAGMVTITASLAGWRTTSRRFEVIGAPVREVVEERWDDGWQERWIIFGDPQPVVTSGFGNIRSFWNRGDGTYPSMAILRRELSARDGLGVELRLSTPLTTLQWQRARTSFVAGIDTAAFTRADPRKAPPSTGRLDAICGVGYPARSSPGGESRMAMTGGISRLVELGPQAAMLQSGAWWTLRIQILPDGRCGAAVNGRVVWLSPEPIPLDGEFRLRLGDESAGTKLLHGPLRVWTGVRTDIDWSRAPN